MSLSKQVLVSDQLLLSKPYFYVFCANYIQITPTCKMILDFNITLSLAYLGRRRRSEAPIHCMYVTRECLLISTYIGFTVFLYAI